VCPKVTSAKDAAVGPDKEAIQIAIPWLDAKDVLAPAGRFGAPADAYFLPPFPAVPRSKERSSTDSSPCVALGTQDEDMIGPGEVRPQAFRSGQHPAFFRVDDGNFSPGLSCVVGAPDYAVRGSVYGARLVTSAGVTEP
jgi:hypothetical protein